MHIYHDSHIEKEMIYTEMGFIQFINVKFPLVWQGIFQ